LVREARKHILAGDFKPWKKWWWKIWTTTKKYYEL
jgi:hypothetical protein